MNERWFISPAWNKPITIVVEGWGDVALISALEYNKPRADVLAIHQFKDTSKEGSPPATIEEWLTQYERNLPMRKGACIGIIVDADDDAMRTREKYQKVINQWLKILKLDENIVSDQRVPHVRLLSLPTEYKAGALENLLLETTNPDFTEIRLAAEMFLQQINNPWNKAANSRQRWEDKVRVAALIAGSKKPMTSLANILDPRRKRPGQKKGLSVFDLEHEEFTQVKEFLDELYDTVGTGL